MDALICCKPPSNTFAELQRLRRGQLMGPPRLLQTSSQACSGLRSHEQILETLRRHAQSNELTLFIGAGLSIPAGLPSWGTLLVQLKVRMLQALEEPTRRYEAELEGLSLSALCRLARAPGYAGMQSAHGDAAAAGTQAATPVGGGLARSASCVAEDDFDRALDHADPKAEMLKLLKQHSPCGRFEREYSPHEENWDLTAMASVLKTFTYNSKYAPEPEPGAGLEPRSRQPPSVPALNLGQVVQDLLHEASTGTHRLPASTSKQWEDMDAIRGVAKRKRGRAASSSSEMLFSLFFSLFFLSCSRSHPWLIPPRRCTRSTTHYWLPWP